MTAKKKIDTPVDGEQLTLNTGTTPETEKENSEAVTQATVIEDIEKADIVEFGKKDLRTYNSLMNGIEKGFNKASEAYITIGCALYQIHHNEYFRIDNYKNIAEFALDKYELKKATTHNYIRVIERFGNIVDGKPSGLKEEFKSFKCSQLVAMLNFTPDQIAEVEPDWTTRQIVQFGKNPLLTADSEEDDENIIDGDAVVTESDSLPDADVMPVPEIETGCTLLESCDSFEELLKNREKYENAFNDMRKDKNFQKQKNPLHFGTCIRRLKQDTRGNHKKEKRKRL